jgi:hypothetical protein
MAAFLGSLAVSDLHGNKCSDPIGKKKNTSLCQTKDTSEQTAAGITCNAA